MPPRGCTPQRGGFEQVTGAPCIMRTSQPQGSTRLQTCSAPVGPRCASPGSLEVGRLADENSPACSHRSPGPHGRRCHPERSPLETGASSSPVCGTWTTRVTSTRNSLRACLVHVRLGLDQSNRKRRHSARSVPSVPPPHFGIRARARARARVRVRVRAQK
jgi:hypothetical protein